MHLKFRLALLAGVLPTLIQAQVMGNYAKEQTTYQNVVVDARYRAIPRQAEILEDGTIEITINALSNQQADVFTAIFTVFQAGKTVEETNRLLNVRMDAFLKELVDLGIAREDLYVDMVNFVPKYEYDVSKKIFSKKTLTEVPTGFELQKNVHITYGDPELLDRILTVAAGQEIYDIVKVDHFIREPQKVYQELRQVAFGYLDTIKLSYLEMGVPLDSSRLITAENAWVAYPINRYESYQAYSSSALGPQDRNGAVIRPADKPTLRFYDAVPANDYDIVLNPEILRPAVQFSFNLKARFFLPPPKPEIQTEVLKEFVLVTPNGEVKRLKIE